MEGLTTKRDFREKKKSWEVYRLEGLGVLSLKIFVFLSSLECKGGGGMFLSLKIKTFPALSNSVDLKS